MARDKRKHLKTFVKIGKNIQKIRLSQKLSQEDLAFAINSARNYVGCIERGEKFPSISFLLDIAEKLNCKLSDLIDDI